MFLGSLKNKHFTLRLFVANVNYMADSAKSALGWKSLEKCILNLFFRDSFTFRGCLCTAMIFICESVNNVIQIFLYVFVCFCVCFFIHHHRMLLYNHNIHLWVGKQCYSDLLACFCLFVCVFLSVHMQVKVNNEVATGTGPNKKVAKRNAAEAMLLQLGYKASTVLQNTTDVWTLLLVFTPTCICYSQFIHLCHCSFILLFQSNQIFVQVRMFQKG